MKLRPDDDIYRFQPVWRDLRGWELPFTARYVVWAAWAGIAFPLLVALVILTPLNFLYCVVISAGISAAVTYLYVADKITAENSLDAVFAALYGEATDLQEHNATKAAEKRDVPRTLNFDDFDYLTFQPDPTNNPVNWLRKPSK